MAAASRTPTSSTPQPGAGDPRPGRYALAQQLLDQCHQQDGKTDLPGTALFDDGTHGDLVAGDGVYSLAFGTTLEGSYNFRFHVRGTDSDGTKFGRTSLLSQYVQVAPTAQATATSLQLGSISGGLQTAYAFFLPRDNLGNHLGPGFASEYHVNVNGGATVGSVLDLGRGVYGQQIVYPAKAQPPEVIVEGHDPCFRTIIAGGPPSGGTGIPGWLLRHCGLLLLLLILLVLVLLSVIVALLRRRH
jgi:hypothetical protein